MRNFFDICDKIVSTLEILDESAKTNIDHTLAELQFPPDLRSCVIEHLQDIQMTSQQATDFMYGLNKIKRAIYYLPPEQSAVAWEKLCKLCYTYLESFGNTVWAQQISVIIRGL